MFNLITLYNLTQCSGVVEFSEFIGDFVFPAKRCTETAILQLVHLQFVQKLDTADELK